MMLVFSGSLVVVSAYQPSPYKNRRLFYCQTRFGSLTEYHRPGFRGAAEISVRFTVLCAGCCLALFAVMVVVGSMNILWMAGFTVVLSLERIGEWGDRLAR